MNTSIFLFSIIASSFVLVGYITLEYKKVQTGSKSSSSSEDSFSEVEEKMKEIQKLDIIKKNKKIQEVAVKTALFKKVYEAKNLVEEKKIVQEKTITKPIVPVEEKVIPKEDKKPIMNNKKRFDDAAERIRKKLLEAA